MKQFHVLNLGAGVQSTCLYLLSKEIHFDVAIFADTGEEPEAVYQHLRWLQLLEGSGFPRILVRTAGKLGDDLVTGRRGKGQSFASIPAFTAPSHKTRPAGKVKEGKSRRQCTSEYKIQVVEKTIRREIIGLARRQPMPKGVRVHQYFGISLDEECRAKRAEERFKKLRWCRPHYPLIERKWTRWKCLSWLKTRVPHPVPRSACVFCPYKEDSEWLRLKESDPEGWARAVEVDDNLRKPGSIVNRGLKDKLYVHRSCVPLKMVDFGASSVALDSAVREIEGKCIGMCGL